MYLLYCNASVNVLNTFKTGMALSSAHILWETTRDRAIVTIERQQEVICALSHGDISNDLEWPLTWVSRSRSRDTYSASEVTTVWRYRNSIIIIIIIIITNRISKKRCVLWTQLLKNTNRKPYTIYRMVQLSMTLSHLWPRFQGHEIFRHWISQKRHEIEP